MRLIPFLFLLLFHPGTTAAQTVRVDSGEHGSFTRLVFLFPATAQWEFGRAEDGYAFRLAGQRPRFIIDRVFDKIGRNRLALMRVDEKTASLRIGLACACHAFPFEFRPGIVVVDLRDGQPPPGSAFERPIVSGEDATLPPARSSGLRPIAGLDLANAWVSDALRGTEDGTPPALPILPALPDPALSTMRQELVEGFARAASEGLIDPVTRLRPSAAPAGRAAPDAPPMRVDEDPLDSRTALTSVPPLAADGGACPAAGSLALADWGDARPVSVQFADQMAGLTGEFDQPAAEAVIRAVRFHLHLGFGAEARALLEGLPIDHPDTAYWLSLATLLDGVPDPEGPFPALASCDGPAALWAALADPSLSSSSLNLPALVRAYSALPPHLRRHVGPPLVERFLTSGDRVTATELNDILQRIPSTDDPRVRIAAARVAEANGADTVAERAVAGLLADPGPAQPEALAALVDLHLRDGRPVDDATVDALAAFLAEAADPPLKERLFRAHILALALANRFDEAFAALPPMPAIAEEVWSLATKAEDVVIIGHAFGTDPVPLSPHTRQAIAERLLALGFPDEASRWSAAPIPRPVADPDPARRAILARDWSALATDGPEPWRQVAAYLSPTRTDQSGLLGRGRMLATESQSTRAAVDALLSALPEP